MKFGLKLTPPVKSVAALLCKKWTADQLYIPISKNNRPKLYLRRHLFHGFLFVYFFFFSLRQWCPCKIIAIFCLLR